MGSHEKISSNNTLPLVLISASDLQNASALISELISSDVVKDNDQTTKGTVWRIVNKYYCVDVELYPMADDTTPSSTLAERLEAHIIYISEKEDDAAAADRAEDRWRRGVTAGVSRADVRLVVVAATGASPGLLAWCRRRRYEPVPLRESAADRSDDEDADAAAAPFPETYGAERARAALHAHAWRGLRRRDRPPAEHSGAGEDEAAVERAEAFAEALGALGEAGEAGGAAGEPREERLRRAERLVAAFCRALGSDLPSL